MYWYSIRFVSSHSDNCVKCQSVQLCWEIFTPRHIWRHFPTHLSYFVLKLQLINMQKYSRDCVGNMNEQNSGIFFLIQMLWLLSEWPEGCKTMLQQNPSFLVVGAG